MKLQENKDATMNLLPSDFLIDEKFKIAKAHYGKHLDNHISFEEFKEFAGI